MRQGTKHHRLLQALKEHHAKELQQADAIRAPKVAESFNSVLKKLTGPKRRKKKAPKPNQLVIDPGWIHIEFGHPAPNPHLAGMAMDLTQDVIGPVVSSRNRQTRRKKRLKAKRRNRRKHS